MPRRRRRSTRRNSASRISKAAALTGYRQFGLRAYRLENPAQVGKSIAGFRKANPEYRIVNVLRGGEALGADPDLVLQKGDVIALGGSTEHLTDKMGLIGPEVADAKALGVPLDQAEILVTNKEYGRTDASNPSGSEAIAGQLQVTQGRTRWRARFRPVSRPNCSGWTSSRLSA